MIFSDQNFKQEVEEADGLVLVDFFAEWCGPCKMMAPIIDELVNEYDKKGVKIGKLNVDENRGTAEKYNVMGIPTLILFMKGKVLEQLVGYQPKEELQSFLNKKLAESKS